MEKTEAQRATDFAAYMKAGKIYFVAGVAYRSQPEKHPQLTEAQRIAVFSSELADNKIFAKLQVAA
jgi:hypothetical protein